jgi:hypothetical protein
MILIATVALALRLLDFAMLFTLRESQRTSDLVLSRVRGKRLQLHPRRLGSEALRLLQRWSKDCLKTITEKVIEKNLVQGMLEPGREITLKIGVETGQSLSPTRVCAMMKQSPSICPGWYQKTDPHG